MRLSSEQIRIITRIVRKHLGEVSKVRLFGSRVDDTTQGGDIDLLVELHAPCAIRDEILAAGELEQELGLPVDLVTTHAGERSRPIVEIARLTGIPL